MRAVCVFLVFSLSLSSMNTDTHIHKEDKECWSDFKDVPVEVWDVRTRHLLDRFWLEVYQDETLHDLSAQLLEDLHRDNVNVHTVLFHEGSVYVNGTRAHGANSDQ